MKREEMTDKEAEIYKSCLWKKTTVDELETKKIVRKGNECWRELKSRMIEGDELWQYSSPAEDWKNLMGEAGIALLRNGEIVEVMMTLHN